MNKFKTMITAVMLGMSAAATAQSAYIESDGDTTVFKRHAFLQLQAGGQYTLGEAKFGDLLSPNVQAALGMQFNPWFGARLAVNAWQSKGGYNGYHRAGGTVGNTTYKWRYISPTVDFMFNLSQLICGYNPHRVLNVTAFVGGGVNAAFHNGEANDLCAQGYKMQYVWSGKKVRPVGRAGIGIDFRLSDAVSIGVEGNANILSDKYNSKRAENADWYFNALAGVRINLGKTKSTRRHAEEPAVQPATEQHLAETPQTPREQPARQKEEIRRDIHFLINSDKVDEVGQRKIAELADFLNRHPDSSVTIEGYADRGTGSPAYNKAISERRALAVFNLLTRRHGIAAHRVTYTFKGDTVQVFPSNDDNRVAICVGTAE